LNDASEARIEPPIQAEYCRSAGAAIRIFTPAP
jgi:hypothetical protein